MAEVTMGGERCGSFRRPDSCDATDMQCQKCFGVYWDGSTAPTEECDLGKRFGLTHDGQPGHIVGRVTGQHGTQGDVLSADDVRGVPSDGSKYRKLCDLGSIEHTEQTLSKQTGRKKRKKRGRPAGHKEN